MPFCIIILYDFSYIQIPKALADKVLAIANLEETIKKEKEQLKADFAEELNLLFSKETMEEDEHFLKEEDSSRSWCSLL